MSEAQQDDGPLTLGKAFGKDVKKEIATAVKGRGKDAQLGRTRRFLWWLVQSSVNTRVDELMDLPLGDDLGSAYLRLQEVQNYVRKVENNAKKGLLPLPFLHEITLEREHAWAVEVHRSPVGKLEFDIQLELKFGQDANLRIKDGCLVALIPGSILANGTFDCKIDGKPVNLPPIKNHGLFLPHIPFDPAIRILPAELLPPSDRRVRIRRSSASRRDE